MFRTNFLTGFRKILKDKFYAVINVGGLAIGLAACFLIILYVRDETSYDSFHDNADNIYRICALGSIGDTPINQTYTCAPLPATMIADYPEVVQACRIAGKWDVVLNYEDKTFYESEVLVVDSTFFNVFSFELLEGNPATVLRENNTVVISESMAKKYFGEKNAMGKSFQVATDSEEDPITVVGIVKDVPSNSHFHFDILLPLSQFEFSRQENWWNNNFKTYLVLQDGFDYRVLESKLPDFIRKYLGGDDEQWDEWLAGGNYWEFILQPIKDIHLTSDLNGEIESNGNIQYVRIFSIVGIIILLIACINFMNLSTARSASRAKEVGIRKVEGALRRSLIGQFMTESALFTILSALIAALLIILVLPAYNQLTQKEFGVQLLFSTEGLLILVGLMIIIAGLAGTYPAFYLSSFHPTVIFSGLSKTGRGKSWLRAVLVVIQFCLSIALIAGTFTVYSQLAYFQNKELGFERDQIIVIHRPGTLEDKIISFKNSLLENASIRNVSSSSALMGLGFNNWGCSLEGNEENEWSTLNMFVTDHDFLETFDMDMDKGRFFSHDFPSDSGGLVINQAAAKLFEFDDVIGRKVWYGGREGEGFRVIGVMKDFHYESFHQVIRPAALMLLPGIWGVDEDYISVKINGGNIPETVDYIEDRWDEFTGGLPMEFSFFDEEYDELYRNEKRTGNVMTLFSIIAIFIASLGLLGLVSFTTEQRTKEIGIRKVQGASAGRILIHLWKDFGKWILVAAILSVPLAWYTMNNWLQNFAYRIDFSWWTLAAATAMAFVLAVFTVSIQTVRAARANPADSLRYE
ncbi:ABC transporter permease [Bacteroidota bacterium]